MSEPEFKFNIKGKWDGRKSVDMELFEGGLKLTSPPGFDGEMGVMWPEEVFTATLISCLFNTFRDIAKRMRVEYSHWEADAQTALGTDPEGSFKFYSIKAHIKLKTNEENKDKISKLMYLTKKYCLISKAIKGNIDEEITYELIE